MNMAMVRKHAEPCLLCSKHQVSASRSDRRVCVSIYIHLVLLYIKTFIAFMIYIYLHYTYIVLQFLILLFARVGNKMSYKI